LRIAAVSRPAFETGGDFHRIRPLSDGRTIVVIGDVCGRGAPAAHWVAELEPRLDRLLCNRDDVENPTTLLTELNRSAIGLLPDDCFATAACAIFDSRRAALTIASAGHVPIVIKRAGAAARVVGRASGPPIGMFDHALYCSEHLSLRAGDLVLLMTDGVLEPLEQDFERLECLKALVERVPHDAHASMLALLEEVERCETFPDDRTLVVVQLLRDVSGLMVVASGGTAMEVF
jgi:serine phosphatase RsbU (regulator of sigma subunit)